MGCKMGVGRVFGEQGVRHVGCVRCWVGDGRALGAGVKVMFRWCGVRVWRVRSVECGGVG